MGFETPLLFELGTCKPIFELCPYGIWNEQNKVSFSFALYLNFVPMGFETYSLSEFDSLVMWFELCPYGIWNLMLSRWPIYKKIWTLSLWDLKLDLSAYSIVGSSIWTLSLWDLKRDAIYRNFGEEVIWTLSLWDLKRFALGRW